MKLASFYKAIRWTTQWIIITTKEAPTMATIHLYLASTNALILKNGLFLFSYLDHILHMVSIKIINTKCLI